LKISIDIQLRLKPPISPFLTTQKFIKLHHLPSDYTLVSDFSPEDGELQTNPGFCLTA